MSVSIIRGTNDRPAATEALVEKFRYQPGWSGKLFIGFPVLPAPDGTHRLDALWASKERGLIAFDLRVDDDFELRQDRLANNLEAKLKPETGLTKRRELLIPIHTVSFEPNVIDASPPKDDSPDYPIATDGDKLEQLLEGFRWPESDEKVFQIALQALENIATIRKGRSRRNDARDNSRGAKLGQLEREISTLDNMQSKAVIETVDGIQRIRGLAGSGKTIVLALKAAYLHSQHPNWRIAVTFQTRSLKQYLRKLIHDFCIASSRESPDWSRLQIMHAWGAPGGGDKTGLYHQFCDEHGARYYDFGSARQEFGLGREFAEACERALGAAEEQHKEAGEHRKEYDVILVDEAQDLPPSFLRLCYRFLKESKRLVYAYDELQSLSQESLPSPTKVFGENARWDSASPSHDIILERCYRNSKPVLTSAHALGFGVYRRPRPIEHSGLVQMFDDPKLWQDVGYRVKSGELIGGQRVSLHRTRSTSPRFLEDHSSRDDLIQFKCFRTPQMQARWVAEAIKKNIRDDDLRADDIFVINPDPFTARTALGPIRHQLLERGIDCHLAGVSTDPDTFRRPDSVTFTGVHRSKGNEAGMVYIVNAHDCWHATHNLASIRNRLFTAITRSKAWVRVSGIGPEMEHLKQEFDTLSRNKYELRFAYPTHEQLKKMRIVHRDLTASQVRRHDRYRKTLSELLNELRVGSVHREDMDPDVLNQLSTLLADREGSE